MSVLLFSPTLYFKLPTLNLFSEFYNFHDRKMGQTTKMKSVITTNREFWYDAQKSPGFSGTDLTFSICMFRHQLLNTKFEIFAGSLFSKKAAGKTFAHLNSILFLSPFFPFLIRVTKSKILQKRFNLGLNKTNTTSENIIPHLQL